MRNTQLFGFAVAVCLWTAGAVHAQSKASGTLTIGREKSEIRCAAAVLAPDPFDKAKKVTRILLTDRPIPPEILGDRGQLSDLKSQGYHGLDVEIEADSKGYSAVVISSALDGTLTRSRTFGPQDRFSSSGKRVEGSLDAPSEEAAGTTLSYHIEFAADIAPAEPAPTREDTTAAAGKESTKAYLAMVEAIRSGNKQKILELSPPDKRSAIDTPDFPKLLEMVQAMTPKNITVLKATETGDRASLVASGSLDGQAQRGRVYLNRVNGKWLVERESWESQ